MKLKNIMDDIKHLEEYAKICQVTWGDKKTDEELKKAVVDAGYEVTGIE